MAFKSIIIAIGIIIADFFTKVWIIDFLNPIGGYYDITNFFRLVLVYNRGVSFGIMNNDDNSPIYMIGLGAFICLFLIYLWARTDKKYEKIGLSLAIGGGIGNIIDRINYGFVIDFLDFYYQEWHYPAFNLADSAITIGVGFIILATIRKD